MLFLGVLHALVSERIAEKIKEMLHCPSIEKTLTRTIENVPEKDTIIILESDETTNISTKQQKHQSTSRYDP